MKFQSHADKIAYFFIAFALFLLVRACIAEIHGSMLTALLYLSIGLSLLAGNIPRVLDIPMHYAHPVRCVEHFTFGMSVVCFLALCLHHVLYG